jgi:hypothetical protein
MTPARTVAPPHVRDPPGAGGLRIGGYMLGIGLLTGLASALLISIGAEGAGVVGITLATLLFGIGLLVLLISALIYAVSD